MIRNIAILTGGDSAEKEISLKSSTAIEKACIELGYNTTTFEINGNIPDVIQRITDYDFVFIALHGGKGENGVVQGLLDSINIPYNGAGVLASALGMEKGLSKQIAKNFDLNTPEWHIYTNVHEAVNGTSNIKYPVVVKPSADGSTMGLTIVEKKDQLLSAIELASKYDGNILLEVYIKGREMTATIIGDKAYPIVEIVPKHGIYDYECKYEKGLSEYYCPADISDEISDKMQKDALKIYRAIQCRGYARIDFILDINNMPWFLEINTLPGMTETSLVPKSVKAAGISFNSLIQMIIDEAV